MVRHGVRNHPQDPRAPLGQFGRFDSPRSVTRPQMPTMPTAPPGLEQETDLFGGGQGSLKETFCPFDSWLFPPS